MSLALRGWMVVWIAWMSLVGDEVSYRIVVKRADDRVEHKVVDQNSVFVVNSPSGIGRAVIHRPMAGWPVDTALVVKLQLKGLEEFRVSVGEVQWIASVSSHDRRVLLRLKQGQRETELKDPKDRYWASVKIDPSYEVTLPKAIYKDNPDFITLHWIDFFR